MKDAVFAKLVVGAQEALAMARDTKDHAEDKDGFSKNLDKFGNEFSKVKDAVKNAGDSHDPITNAAVEATRASPYLMGHVMLIGGAILVAVIIALVAFG